MAMSIIRLAIGTIPVTLLAIAFFGFDLWAPPGTPAPVANQITKALEQAIKDADYIKASKALVYDPVFTPPADGFGGT